MDLSFEWDPQKAAANRRKHGVSFEQAIPVFGDPLARIFDDPDHSADERREIVLGYSVKPRLLVAGAETNQQSPAHILAPCYVDRTETT